MATLTEGQFELDGFVFGGSRPGAVWVSNVDVAPAKWNRSGVVNEHNGKRVFGRSALVGDTWKFDLSTMTGDMNGSRALLERILAVWRDEDKFEHPEQLSVLRYCKGGITRKLFGRPEEFSFDQNGFLRQGSWTAQGSFVTADAFSYDDEDELLAMSIVSVSTGGVVFPTVFPWTSEPSEARVGLVTVGGYARTPFTAKITGPVLNPVLSGPGWKIDLRMNILEGQTVTIDTRNSTVTRNGVSVANALTADSRLDLAILKPGQTELRFSGVDPMGLARAEFRWASAYNGY